MRKMTRNKDTKGCPLKNFPANPVSGSLIDLRLAKKPPHTHLLYISVVPDHCCGSRGAIGGEHGSISIQLPEPRAVIL